MLSIPNADVLVRAPDSRESGGAANGRARLDFFPAKRTTVLCLYLQRHIGLELSSLHNCEFSLSHTTGQLTSDTDRSSSIFLTPFLGLLRMRQTLDAFCTGCTIH